MTILIKDIRTYLAAPEDREALRQLAKHALRNTIGAPVLTAGTADLSPSVRFEMEDNRGNPRTIRTTLALYAVFLVANALGHDLHINHRAKDDYGYLRVVTIAAPGSLLEAEFGGEGIIQTGKSKPPYNFDAQRILMGAGSKGSAHPLSSDRLNLTYGNWRLKGGSAKADEASFALAILVPPRGWTSLFTGSPAEQAEAAKVLLMQALENLDREREEAIAALAARKIAAE